MAQVEKQVDVEASGLPSPLLWPWLELFADRSSLHLRMRRRPVLTSVLAIALASVMLNALQHFVATNYRSALGSFRHKEAARFPFTLPEASAPVAETTDSLTIDNHPVSPWRPQNQFWSPVPRSAPQPIVALATVVSEHPDLAALRVSYESLRAQSLRQWHWYIFDARPQPTILAAQDLRLFARLDPRITVIRHERFRTPVQGRNGALEVFVSSKAPYAAFLAANDVLELTLLEKAAWTLATVTNWDLVGFFEAMFGEERAVTHDGVHSGARNLNETLIPDGTIFRVKALESCRFEQGPTEKASFWSFWVCFASQGRWGGSLPELGSWRRETPFSKQRQRLRSEYAAAERWFVRQSHPRLLDHPEQFPAKEPPRSVSLEPITWSPPFDNVLPEQPGKSIMIIQGWLLVGGSELGVLDILRKFAEAGYRVTMVLTRFKYPDGVALRPRVAQYTHDIHFLPAFTRMHDFPRYIKYLIDSRGIDTVLMSNSLLAYEILPSLFEMTPRTRWIDYLHNEAYDGWKYDGFPSLSLASRRYLDRTITCSEHLREFLIARGYPAKRLGVVKLGINVTRFDRIDDEERSLVKTQVLSLPEDTIVLANSARLDNQKRPWLVPDIIRYVRDRLAEENVPGVAGIKMLMMGEGPLRGAIEERIKATDTTDQVTLLGIIDEPERVLRGTDLFLLPSAIEGISVAIAEAMAIGIPIITSLAGGLPEELGHLQGSQAVAGRLIELNEDEADEIKRFGEATFELIKDHSLRRKLGADAARFVRESFNQDVTLRGMFKEREIAALMARPTFDETPNPAAYFGISEMILEDRVLADMQVAQRRLGEIRRPGPAGDLQAQCVMESDGAMRWIDSVAENRICRDSPPSDTTYLFKSAREQCGAWCVWDLRTREPEGWQFDGTCWTRFEKPSPGCASFFHIRPNFDFTVLPPSPSKEDLSFLKART